MNDQVSAWFTSVSSSNLYPWNQTAPISGLTTTEVARICAALKEDGNKCYKKKEYFNALWKYENCISFFLAYKLVNYLPHVHCNAALCCLMLGETRRRDLIHYKDERCWYIFTCNHARATLQYNPEVQLAEKAHRRRGKALQVINDCSEECQKTWKKWFPSIYPSSPKSLVVFDFSQCFKFASNNNSEYLFDAIIEAVKHDDYVNLPTLTEKHARSGVGTEVLQRLIDSHQTNSKHIECLLLKVKLEYSSCTYFDASKLNHAVLFKKGTYSNNVYTKLKEYGFPVTSDKMADALAGASLLNEAEPDFIQLSTSQGSQNEGLGHDLAKMCNENHFNNPLKDWQRIQGNADSLFSSKHYQEALDEYSLAIDKCDDNNALAILHDISAQASLELGKYNEALTHSCKCIRIGPQNPKGYFRRATTMELILKTSTDQGTTEDVIKDYLKCHSLLENAEALGKAIIIAVDSCCTQLIPKLDVVQIQSGFSNQVLEYIKTHAKLTEALIKFIFLELPSNLERQPYSAELISLKEVLTFTSNPDIICSILEWKIRIKSEDIIAAGDYIPDDSIDVLLNILKCATQQNRSILSLSVLNVACWKALTKNKTRSVAIFVDYGATPHLEKLAQIPGIFTNKSLRDYYFHQIHCNIRRKCDGSIMKEQIEVINTAANEWYKNGQMDEAMYYYKEALRICQAYNFQMEESTFHNNLAGLYLLKKEYQEAYRHADKCIATLQNNAKAYYRRAEASKNCLKKKIKPFNVNSLDVVNDFKTSYKLENNLEVLLIGFPFAMQYGLSTHFKSECTDLDDNSWTKLFHVILKQNNCKPTLSLFFEIWKTKIIDCSTIALRYLIVDRKIYDRIILSWFIASGVTINSSDFEIIVRYLPNDNVDTFSMLLEQCDSVNKDHACQESLKARKISFVVELLQQGAMPPDDFQSLMKELILATKFDDIKWIINNLAKEKIQKLDLSDLLETALVNHHELISMFINAGVNPNGEKSPIVTVMNSKLLKDEQKVNLTCLLIELGADYNQLSRTSQHKTTPLHVATEWALNTDGNVSMINVLVPHLVSNKNSKDVNEKGDTPLHMAIKPHIKFKPSKEVLLTLLQNDLVDPNQRNKKNKRPIDCLKNEDSRKTIIEKHSARAKSTKYKKKDSHCTKPTHDSKKEQKSSLDENMKSSSDENKKPSSDESKKPSSDENKKSSSDEDKKPSSDENKKSSSDENKKSSSDGNKKSSSDEGMNPPNEDNSDCESSQPLKIERPYEYLSSAKKLSYHMKIIMMKDENLFTFRNYKGPETENIAILHETQTAQYPENKSHQTSEIPDKTVEFSPKDSGTGHQSYNTVDEADGLTFDNLLWEVEITKDVEQFFKNKKQFSRADRISATKTIQQLAEGRRNKMLYQKVSNRSEICIFEARTTHSARILWETPIRYSSRLSDQLSREVHCNVIRVWAVVIDHDKLNEHIKRIEHQALAEFERVNKGIKYEVLERPEDKHGPTVYFIESPDSGLLRNDIDFSDKDRNIIPIQTFYSFDSSTIKSYIDGTNDKREYPFKVSHEEHQIIKLRSHEAILLIGRSGTGKTTCCLYRLWNECKNYWDPNSPTFGIKLQNRSDKKSFYHKFDNNFVEHLPSIQDKEYNTNLETVGTDQNDDMTADETSSELLEESEEINLHQVFVSKNYILCDLMKKEFYKMAAACDYFERQMVYEKTPIPNSFNKINDLAFPAFLTAHQYYVILDNSLEDDKQFFPRNENGDLLCKIYSWDYNMQDLDIPFMSNENDSEDEDDMVYSVQNPAKRQSKSDWTQVTSLYFKEIIWPNILKHCKGKEKVDPLLVWLEIRSFIKGSELAVRKGSPLNLEDYKEIGDRMAPNYSTHRDLIYQLYLCYQKYLQNQRYKCILYDECDLVLNLHKRIKDAKWSIHTTYIDEVQDFTQAELLLFIRTCRLPNYTFFTGDSAQSIMRGIAFRFRDLRSCFHQLNLSNCHIKVPEKPYTLTVNYRSHSGIVKLAASIIDLITEFFKDSIDCLPKERGQFPGPLPIFLNISEIEELSLLLSSNEHATSTMGFGAHQAILVHNDKARENLPTIFSGANCLTIYEAKGLEFNDVLIYNFFSDSLIEEKVWNMITSYMENSSKMKLCEIMQHKSLNAELKCLYTAVTRAKCNLWIYESDDRVRYPVMRYWQKRNVVKIISMSVKLMKATKNNTNGDQDGNYMRGFASESDPCEWKDRGDIFMNSGLWQRARICYKRAGPDYLNLVKEAEAFQFIQDARQSKPALYLEAAILFLESCDLRHSNVCIRRAAFCLKNCKPHKYTEAAELFEKLGCLEEAAGCYFKANQIANFITIQERHQAYDSVIQGLLRKRRRKDALLKAVKYEKEGFHFSSRYSTTELSLVCAKFYSKKKKIDSLKDILHYMPQEEKRLQFLKEAELFKDVYDHYVSHQQFKNAYELALARNWFNKAVELAEKQNDETYLTQFTFLQARSFCVGEHEYDFKKIEERLRKLQKSRLLVWRAEANLLLGKTKQEVDDVEQAFQLYKKCGPKAGILESFKLKQSLKKSVSVREFLDCYHMAKHLSKTIKNKTEINFDVQETMKFYGLKLIGKVYIAPTYSHCFIKSENFQKYACEKKLDQNGMIRLKPEVKEVFVEYFDKLFDYSQFEKGVFKEWKSSQMYSILYCFKSLPEPLQSFQLSTTAIGEYLLACINVLDLKTLKKLSNNKVMSHILHIFSPEVSMFVLGLNKEHIRVIRNKIPLIRPLKEDLFNNLRKCFEKDRSNHKLCADSWLKIWRSYCLTFPNSTDMCNVLQEIEEKVNKNRICPAGYIEWRNSKSTIHLLRLWLNSCEDIRSKSKPNVLRACNLVIKYFLGSIIENENISIKIINLVNICTIHTAALLVMMTHANHISGYPNNFWIPQVYTHAVEVFNFMNCYNEAHRSLFSACDKFVSTRLYVLKLFGTCRHLLEIVLSYLLGMHEKAPNFCTLRFSLNKFTHEKESIQSLILTLTILGNLCLVSNTMAYKIQIYEIFKKFALLNPPKLPQYAHLVLDIFKTPDRVFQHDIMELVSKCLKMSCQDPTILKLSYNTGGNNSGYTEMTAVSFKSNNPVSSSSEDQISTTSYIPPSSNIPPSIPQETQPTQFQKSNSSSELGQSSEQSSISDFDDDDNIDGTIHVPQMPSVNIEPRFITTDIVDDTNLFCNVCGVHYREDGVDQTIEEFSDIDSYTSHFSGQNHQYKTECFWKFREILSLGDASRNLAEEKIDECESLNALVENPKLYQCSDSIKEEIDRYDVIVSDSREKRLWIEGAQKTEEIHERLKQLLEDADNCHCKVKTAMEELKKNKAIREAQENDDDMKEMELEENGFQTPRSNSVSHSKMEGKN